MTQYAPIPVPPLQDLSWRRAETIARVFRAKGKSNPIIVAAVANALAESAWKPVIVGDHGESFGPWQCKFAYYGAPILAATNVDIRTEPDLAKHVDAVCWLIWDWRNGAQWPFADVAASLDKATTGADATRIWAAGFERASAGGAVDRRVAIAPTIEAWLAKLP